MFTQSCYIRKNNLELRNELVKLGYVRDQLGEESEKDYPYLACEGKFYWYAAEDAMLGDFIDCGTNNALFLAIASLRDDSDKDQWFICDYDEEVDDISENPSMFLCKSDNVEDYIYSYMDDIYIGKHHKASVEELIAHFK